MAASFWLDNSFGGKGFNRCFEDKDKKNAIAFELATMAEKHAQELAKGQIEVNKTEAAHKSLFVAGWRPCIGWICGLALLYSTLIAPILNIWFTVPPVNNDLLSTILLGMLGLAGARTVEKAFNVQRER